MKEQYEPIKFETWQELAKYVIDGGEVYWCCNRRYHKILCNESGFNIVLCVDNLFTKKQPTLEELIAIKPRLCWVWDHKSQYKYVRVVEFYNGYYKSGCSEWDNAQMLTDDEIKKFLSDGE